MNTTPVRFGLFRSGLAVAATNITCKVHVDLVYQMKVVADYHCFGTKLLTTSTLVM
jgi:hypothetical protein